MTTPTTTTIIITKTTTMMTDVVVASSLGELLRRGMLLVTGTVVVIAPSLLMGRVMWLTGTVVVVAPLLVGIVVGSTLQLVGTVSDMVIALSLTVGCVLLQTGTVAVVVIAPTVWELMVSSGIDAVESKYIASICMACHQWHGQGRAHWSMHRQPPLVASVLCTAVLRSMVCLCCALALSITWLYHCMSHRRKHKAQSTKFGSDDMQVVKSS